MKIGIVGLGLIGGSFARAIKKYTPHEVCGIDADDEVIHAAHAAHAIDSDSDVSDCDAVFVCLYPRASVDWILGAKFKNGAVVADMCGIKQYVADRVALPLRSRGIRYVGTHPMAGRELSGFFNSDADLFLGASFIITEDENTDAAASELVAALAHETGFTRVTRCSAQKHDQVIAYTSQFPHVVSNAFVKSPASRSFSGFSAGSFMDLTRVAKMNPAMWAELFILNAEELLGEVDELTRHLAELRQTIAAKDENRLCELLKAGSDIKEFLNGEYKKNVVV